MNSEYFSYVLKRDYGFAPNPFNGICTLATCKPQIRIKAQVDDWIIGTSSTANKKVSRIIFIMKVNEKISFNEYWEDLRFQIKKPVKNGSLKKMYGDNIYHHDGKQWCQLPSHHSLPDGQPNLINLERDISGKFVLISEEFYYFGKKAVDIPKEFIKNVTKKGPGYRKIEFEWGQKLYNFISNNYNKGYQDDPQLFTHFEVYDGKS